MTDPKTFSAASVRRRKPTRAKQLGIKDDEYARMFREQGGVCAICGHPPKKRRLHSDHDHHTMTVRGLLCFRCNRALPNYVTAEWLLAAYAYVNRNGEADVPDQWASLRAPGEARRPEPIDRRDPASPSRERMHKWPHGMSFPAHDDAEGGC